MTSGNLVGPGAGAGPGQGYGSRLGGGHEPVNLGDILERVLDKGIVIVGDIRVNLLDIELLTIKLKLLVASADKAKELGINWWESDPFLMKGGDHADGKELEQRVARLEQAAGVDEGRS